MPVQICNSHGCKPDGMAVNFMLVGYVDPASAELTLDEDAIPLPGAVRGRPVK